MEIPKIIHYCWFGNNPLTPLAEKCVQSWGKFCPDYEIKRWDESNFDINCHPFVKEAYEEKKWAFVSDYVRVWALYEFGGVYLDADAEVIKDLEPIMCNSAVTGYEEDMWIPAALMASEKGNPWIKSLLDYYDGRHFRKEDGTLDVKPNTAIITELSMEKWGFKIGDKTIDAAGVTLLDSEYLTPYKINAIGGGEPTFKIDKDKTYVIHHFAGSWATQYKGRSLVRGCKAMIRRILPRKLYIKIKKKLYKNKNEWK